MSDPKSLLEKTFGPGGAVVVAEAPGRVNIIGEHTDYNDGLVLPFAIQMTTKVALRRRSGRHLRVVSDAYGEPVALTIPQSLPDRQGAEWYDYVPGILWSFRDHLPSEVGLDVAIASGVPLGRGMSSSAALEVALALGLQSMFGIRLNDLELAERSQAAEIEYVGTHCGIMDQYASLMARNGTALLLDIRSMEHQHVLAELPGMMWVVIDSGVRRHLASSGYNARRNECTDALARIRRLEGFRTTASLRDIGASDLSSLEQHLPALMFRRVRHVVEENARVLRTVDALQEGEAAAVGRLLSESHVSLRDDFEVSLPEVDFLVDTGRRLGALGARIMGGGFGGATLHLIPSKDLEQFESEVTKAYTQETGIDAAAIPVIPSAGARQRVEESM